MIDQQNFYFERIIWNTFDEMNAFDEMINTPGGMRNTPDGIRNTLDGMKNSLDGIRDAF